MYFLIKKNEIKTLINPMKHMKTWKEVLVLNKLAWYLNKELKWENPKLWFWNQLSFNTWQSTRVQNSILQEHLLRSCFVLFSLPVLTNLLFACIDLSSLQFRGIKAFLLLCRLFSTLYLCLFFCCCTKAFCKQLLFYILLISCNW